jgi:hypothetical protein
VFTRATQNFGTWRDSHSVRRRYLSRPTGGFVLALSAAALVAWIVFLIVWRVRGDYYLVENSLVPLTQISSQTPGLMGARRAAVSLAVFAPTNGGADATVLFEDGRIFKFPAAESDLSAYIDSRADTVEYIAMLTMRTDDVVSRVQLWPDRALSPKLLDALIRVFASKGFDDFDIAVRAGGKS